MEKEQIIPKEEIEKLRMADKKEEKKLTIEEQIKQDIARFNVQILQLDAQIKNIAGAKAYAENLLKGLQEKKVG